MAVVRLESEQLSKLFLMLLMLMVMVVEPVSLIEGDAHVRLDLGHRLSQYQARLVIVSPGKKHGCGLFYHIYHI